MMQALSRRRNLRDSRPRRSLDECSVVMARLAELESAAWIANLFEMQINSHPANFVPLMIGEGGHEFCECDSFVS